MCPGRDAACLEDTHNDPGSSVAHVVLISTGCCEHVYFCLGRFGQQVHSAGCVKVLPLTAMSRDLERVSHFAHGLVAGSLRLCKRPIYEQNRLVQ